MGSPRVAPITRDPRSTAPPVSAPATTRSVTWSRLSWSGARVPTWSRPRSGPEEWARERRGRDVRQLEPAQRADWDPDPDRAVLRRRAAPGRRRLDPVA